MEGATAWLGDWIGTLHLEPRLFAVFCICLLAQRDAFAAAAGGPRLRGRPEADPEGMAACGQSLEGFAQMQCCMVLVLPAPIVSPRSAPSLAPSCNDQTDTLFCRLNGFENLA